jgi:hypothetical protein
MAEMSVDDSKLEQLGNDIEELGGTLDTAITAMDGLTITPGDFDAGTDFKAVVEDRADQLVTNLKQTKTMLADINTTLQYNVKEYRKTDDDNQAEVKTFGDSFEKVAPGFDEFEPIDKT